MDLNKISEDKENLEADIRILIIDFFNKHPEVGLEIVIYKHLEVLGIKEILTHVDVKLNAEIKI